MNVVPPQAPLVRERLRVVLSRCFERPATHQGDVEVSFADLGAWIESYGQQLAEHGLSHGARVAVAMRNSPQMLALLLTCLRDGLTIVNINYRYSAGEVTDVLRTTSADVLVHDRDLDDELRTVDGGAGRFCVDEVDPVRQSEPPSLQLRRPVAGPAGRDGDVPVLILLTGGTTGRPKGVVYGETALSAIADSVFPNLGWPVPASAQDFDRLMASGAGEQVRLLQMAPMMHGTGMFNALRTFLVGGSVGFMPHSGFDGAYAVDLVDRRRISDVSLVGDAFGRVLADQLATGPSPRHSPARVMSSGAFLSRDVRDALITRWQCLVIDHISASEGGPFATRRVGDDGLGVEDPAFVLAPGAHVIDAAGRVIDSSVGATGFLAASGVQADGYLDDPQASASVWRTVDGRRFCVPGDRVLVAGDRRVTLLGRDSSVVNTGGEKVQLEEVERALLGIEGVRGAAACGLPDPRLGNRIVALVQWDEGASTVDSDGLRARLRPSMAGYKLPKSIHAVPELPVGPSGKLRRRDVLALCHQFQRQEEA